MSKTPIMIWEDPPATRGGALKYAAQVAAVMERPNTWAQIARPETDAAAHAIATLLRKAPHARLAHPGRLLVTYRKIATGDYGVWIKWIPPGGAQ